MVFTEDQLVNVFSGLTGVQTGTMCSNTSVSMKLVFILSFTDQASQVIGQALFILTSLDKTFVIIMLIFVMWVWFMFGGFFLPISSASSITPQFLASLNLKLFKFIISTSKDDYLALSKQP